MFEDIIGEIEELVIHVITGSVIDGVEENEKSFLIINFLHNKEIGRATIKESDPFYELYEKAWIKKHGEKP
jgi:hypothetical protein